MPPPTASPCPVVWCLSRRQERASWPLTLSNDSLGRGPWTPLRVSAQLSKLGKWRTAPLNGHPRPADLACLGLPGGQCFWPGGTGGDTHGPTKRRRIAVRTWGPSGAAAAIRRAQAVSTYARSTGCGVDEATEALGPSVSRRRFLMARERRRRPSPFRRRGRTGDRHHRADAREVPGAS